MWLAIRVLRWTKAKVGCEGAERTNHDYKSNDNKHVEHAHSGSEDNLSDDTETNEDDPSIEEGNVSGEDEGLHDYTGATGGWISRTIL